jgi:CDP-glucose 4,6-dehydratase
MQNHFWKDKKVLVTGALGFLGGHLAKTLAHKQAKVWGLDCLRPPAKHPLLSKEDFKLIKTVKADVRDLGAILKLLRKNKIEVIFHLAAQSWVGICLEKPLEGFKTNIEGAWNILEAARQTPGVKSIVVASSDKAYGAHPMLPYTEDFALLAHHPYDVSKACADLLAVAYAKTYQTPAAVTRCGNIYGPGDLNFSRIVPEAIRCALKGRKLVIRSDGKFTRDYVFIKDIVKAYLLLGQKIYQGHGSGEAFNFSNEKPLSVLEIVKNIYRLTSQRPHFEVLNRASCEIKNQFLCSKKARKILGWKPETTLEQGLKETITWYRKHL